MQNPQFTPSSTLPTHANNMMFAPGSTQVEFATNHLVTRGRQVNAYEVFNLERTSYKFDAIIHLNGPELGNAALQARTDEAFSDAVIGVPVVVAPVAVFSAPCNVRQRLNPANDEEPVQYTYVGVPERLDMNDSDDEPEPPPPNYRSTSDPGPSHEPPALNYRSIGDPVPNSSSNPIVLE